MQTALVLRRFSINSIAAVFLVLSTLTAGGAGGYWLKSQAPSSGTIAAQAPVANATRHAATERAESGLVTAPPEYALPIGQGALAGRKRVYNPRR
jgi:hypothetical protein